VAPAPLPALRFLKLAPVGSGTREPFGDLWPYVTVVKRL
jgi:hypothetical protein